MDKPQNTDNTVVFVLVTFMCVLAIAIFIFSRSDSSKSNESKPSVLSEARALTQCMNFMKSISRDPENAEVPFVPNQYSSSEKEYFFVWNGQTQRMRMNNGLGLSVPATGSCGVNKKTGDLTVVTLNGETIF